MDLQNLALPYKSLIESLENEVHQGTFTAWSCAHNRGILSGFYADEACPPDWLLDVPKTSSKPWMPAFDLASLTKPLLANAWLRTALGADALLWSKTPLANLIEPRNAEGETLKRWAQKHHWLTLAHLLNHTSGFKPWTWFGRALWQQTDEKTSDRPQANPRRRISSRIPALQKDTSGDTARQAQHELTVYLLAQELPTPRPGDEGTTVYSDINYYLIARVIENLTLSEFKGWAGIIDSLNQQWNTEFWHASLDPERSQQAISYFPYIHSQHVAHIYESRKLNNHAGEFGSVHDTNANILATEFRSAQSIAPIVSSHAGLFGSVLDIVKAVPFFLDTQSDFAALDCITSARSSRFCWGLDTPSNASSTAGLKVWPLPEGRSVFGHLGYTGTALWMAEDSQFHTLLTNRTAQRHCVGSVRVPRVLIFMQDLQSTPQCWVNGDDSPTGGWQALNWQDAYALCLEHCRSITRYWDRNILRRPPDLAALRRATGQALWTL